MAQCLSNGWCKGGEDNESIFYLKIVGSDNVRFVTTTDKIVYRNGEPNTETLSQYDCQAMRVRVRASTGGPWSEWRYILPDSIGEVNLRMACRML